MNEHIEEFNHGYAAFKSNGLLSKNPYKLGGPERHLWRQWEEGWFKALDDFLSITGISKSDLIFNWPRYEQTHQRLSGLLKTRLKMKEPRLKTAKEYGARVDGFDDFYDGMPFIENPYRDDERLRRTWEEGWEEGWQKAAAEDGAEALRAKHLAQN